ncbi:hypothetical protein [Pseudoalteromonas sp. SG44-8]|uniref:hypothetical protein n=1 Tax=Pseudoalteromonas sp. SG44-8 TaxID=2760958 RepID=UPI001602B888|nr:hypothetical protein [Pseudoalteromonas sp. SG44-8]MBB1397652.1 hypothetical protein [Pseudoalteromonas sp. SG44-8]
MFAIRITNKQDNGIGHLMRMKHLASALKQHQLGVHIILDDLCQFSQTLYADFKVADVHWQNYEEDALLTINYMHQNSLSHLIVDSYTLPHEYEQLIKKSGFTLTVIDDNERQHTCDFLIDYKWVGPNTKSRYESLVPTDCVRLLGPNYCILDPTYRTVEKHSSESDLPVRVLFSLGGGGDLFILKRIFDGLPRAIQANVLFDIVIGPYATNKDTMYAIGQEFPNINILENVTCLKEYYERASLFVGALGTSFYECAATKTPAITFSLEDNQTNDIDILEWLGHYLHINDVSIDDFLRLGELIDIALSQLPRLQLLVAKRKVSVDGEGARRIAKALVGEKISTNCFAIAEQHCEVKTELTDNLVVCQVDDTHINSYLSARNLPSNSVRMTVQNAIKPLEHYLWWFNQSRFNFVITEREGSRQSQSLYIWHNLYKDKYLYGGWFSCNQDLSLPIAMIALQWQLEFCKASHPNAIWLAVIHKDNKFVNLLNSYMGFVAIPIHSKEYKVTQQLFPLADEQFNFVMWDPNAQ